MGRVADSSQVLTGDSTLPATLGRAVMGKTLREELGFRGVSISDAPDMRALAQSGFPTAPWNGWGGSSRSWRVSSMPCT